MLPPHTGFHGRDWLIADIARWASDPLAATVLVVLGAPGVGKSALAAHLCRAYPEVVLAHYFAGDAGTCDDQALCFVRTTAWQLAQRLPGYRAELEAQLQRDGAFAGSCLTPMGLLPCREEPGCPAAEPARTPTPSCGRPQAQPRQGLPCGTHAAATLWKRLVREPLARAMASGRSPGVVRETAEDTITASAGPAGPIVVMLDAVDPHDSERGHSLARLVKELAFTRNEPLRLLVTSRSVGDPEQELGPCQFEALRPDDARNREDLRRYVEALLRSSRSTARWSAQRREEICEALVAAAAGLFLYARTAFRQPKLLGKLLRSSEPLPAGVEALYRRLLEGTFPDPAAYATKVAPLLEVLVAARGPLSAGLVGQVARRRGARPATDLGQAWDRVEQRPSLRCPPGEVRRRLAPLYAQDDQGTLRPIHGTLSAWLRTAAAGRFQVEANAGDRAFAAWTVEQHAMLPARIKAHPGPVQAYLGERLSTHVREAPDWGLFRKLLADDGFCRLRAEHGALTSLVADLDLVAQRDRVSPAEAKALLAVLPAEGSSASERCDQELRGELHARFGSLDTWPGAISMHLQREDASLRERLFLAFTHDMELRYDKARAVFAELRGALEDRGAPGDPALRWAWRLAVNGEAAALGHSGDPSGALDTLDRALLRLPEAPGCIDRAWLCYHRGIVLLNTAGLKEDEAEAAFATAIADAEQAIVRADKLACGATVGAGGASSERADARSIITSAQHQQGVALLAQARRAHDEPARQIGLLEQAKELFLQGLEARRGQFNHRRAFEQRRLGNVYTALAGVHGERSPTPQEQDELVKKGCASLLDALSTSHRCGHLRYVAIVLAELEELLEQAPAAPRPDASTLRAYREAVEGGRDTEDTAVVVDTRADSPPALSQVRALHFGGGRPDSERPERFDSLPLKDPRILRDTLHGRFLSPPGGRGAPEATAGDERATWFWLVEWQSWDTLTTSPAGKVLAPLGVSPPRGDSGRPDRGRPRWLPARGGRLPELIVRGDERVPLQALYYSSKGYLTGPQGLTRTHRALDEARPDAERRAAVVAVPAELFDDLWTLAK